MVQFQGECRNALVFLYVGNMNKIYGDFLVTYNIRTTDVVFLVYPVAFSDRDDLTSMVFYRSSYSDFLADRNDPDVRKMFHGSYSWRGCWDGRVEFLDDEFYAEEIKPMLELYINHIEPECKELLMLKYPEYADRMREDK